MIAAFPMYDWPEEHAANDAFWSRVRAALGDQAAPLHLTRDRPFDAIWQDPQMLLAQTCGLPFVQGRCGTAIVIARPDYDVEGAGDGTYRSALICRTGAGAKLADFQGKRTAINEFGSQSGCNALADAVLEIGGKDAFFANINITGAHRNSALAVANGEADIAAIDAVAWALFKNHEPRAAENLSVLEWTRPMPALPFITATSQSGHVDILRSALAQAANADTPGIPAGILPANAQTYAPIADMAQRLKGRRLAPETAAL